MRRVAVLSSGDARSALNIIEAAAALAGENRRVDSKLVAEAAQRKTLLYDKAGEEHYNLISALHKTLRASDPDAALYWLARMLEGGEDPMYIPAAPRALRLGRRRHGGPERARRGDRRPGGVSLHRPPRGEARHRAGRWSISHRPQRATRSTGASEPPSAPCASRTPRPFRTI